MYRLIAVSSLILFSSAAFTPRNTCRSTSSAFAFTDGDTVLRDLLADLGKQHDVTFTLEEAVLEDHATGRIRGFRRQPLDQGVDLKTALENLSRTVPNFTWRTDPNNPKIIHIIDDHLLHRNGYALDRKIDVIDFTGTVSGLIDAIAAKGILVSSVGAFDTQELSLTDFSSSVQVNGKNLSAREALSDFISLEGRGRILWFAETHVEGPDNTTYIRFQGAPSKSPVPKK